MKANDALAEFVATVPQIEPGDRVCAVWERHGSEWSVFVPSNPEVEDDSYDLLLWFAEFYGNPETQPRPDAFVFVSGGWAIPTEDMGDDLPPSKHPNRRRVVVSLCATIEGTANRATIQHLDGELEVISGNDDETEAGAGPLSEFVDLCALMVFGVEYSARLILRFVDNRESMSPSVRQAWESRVRNLHAFVTGRLDDDTESDDTES